MSFGGLIDACRFHMSCLGEEQAWLDHWFLTVSLTS